MKHASYLLKYKKNDYLHRIWGSCFFWVSRLIFFLDMTQYCLIDRVNNWEVPGDSTFYPQDKCSRSLWTLVSTYHTMQWHVPNDHNSDTQCCENFKSHKFLGMFAKLRESTINFIMSVCLSICLHGTTRLPLDRFSWNLILEYFLKICRRYSRFIQIRHE